MQHALSVEVCHPNCNLLHHLERARVHLPSTCTIRRQCRTDVKPFYGQQGLPRPSSPLATDFKNDTMVPFFMYGLTKNHGGSPVALDAPSNSRTCVCLREAQMEISWRKSFCGVVGARICACPW